MWCGLASGHFGSILDCRVTSTGCRSHHRRQHCPLPSTPIDRLCFIHAFIQIEYTTTRRIHFSERSVYGRADCVIRPVNQSDIRIYFSSFSIQFFSFLLGLICIYECKWDTRIRICEPSRHWNWTTERYLLMANNKSKWTKKKTSSRERREKISRKTGFWAIIWARIGFIWPWWQCASAGSVVFCPNRASFKLNDTRTEQMYPTMSNNGNIDRVPRHLTFLRVRTHTGHRCYPPFLFRFVFSLFYFLCTLNISITGDNGTYYLLVFRHLCFVFARSLSPRLLSSARMKINNS